MDWEHGRGYLPRSSQRGGVYEAEVHFDSGNEHNRIEEEVNLFFQRSGSREAYGLPSNHPKYSDEERMLDFDDPYDRRARSRGLIPSSYDRHVQKLIQTGVCGQGKNRLREFNNSIIRAERLRSKSPPGGWATAVNLDSTYSDPTKNQLPNRISITLEKVAMKRGYSPRQHSRESKEFRVEPTTNSTFRGSPTDRRYTPNPSVRGWTASSPSLEYSKDSPEGYPNSGRQRDHVQGEAAGLHTGKGYRIEEETYLEDAQADRAQSQQDEDEDDGDPEFASAKSKPKPVTQMRNPKSLASARPAGGDPLLPNSDSDEERQQMYERIERETKQAFLKGARGKAGTGPRAGLTAKQPARQTDQNPRTPTNAVSGRESQVSATTEVQRATPRVTRNNDAGNIRESGVRPPGESQVGTMSFGGSRQQVSGQSPPFAQNLELNSRHQDIPVARLTDSRPEHPQDISGNRSSLDSQGNSSMHLSLRNLQKEVNLKNEQIKDLKQQLQRMVEETASHSAYRRPQEGISSVDEPRLNQVQKHLKQTEELLVFAKQSIQQKTKWINRLQGLMSQPEYNYESGNPDLVPPNDSSITRELDEAISETKHLLEDLETAAKAPGSQSVGPTTLPREPPGSVGIRSNSSFDHQAFSGADSQEKVLVRCIEDIARALSQSSSDNNQAAGWNRWEALVDKVQSNSKDLFKLQLMEQTTNEKVASLSKSAQVLENLTLAKSEELRQKESAWVIERDEMNKKYDLARDEFKKKEREIATGFKEKVESLEQQVITLKAQASTAAQELQRVSEIGQLQKQSKLGVNQQLASSKHELLDQSSSGPDAQWKYVHLALEYASSKIVGQSHKPSLELQEFMETLKESPCSAVAHNFERFLEVERNHQTQLANTYKEKFLNQNNFLQEMQLHLEVFSDIVGIVERFNKSSIKRTPEALGAATTKVVSDITTILDKMQIEKHKLQSEIAYARKKRSENSALVREISPDIVDEYENSLRGQEFPEYHPPGARMVREEEGARDWARKPGITEVSEEFSRNSHRGSLFAKNRSPKAGELIDLTKQKFVLTTTDRGRQVVGGSKEVASDCEPLERRRLPVKTQKPQSYTAAELKESDLSMHQEALERHSMKTEPALEFDPDMLQLLLAQGRVIQENLQPVAQRSASPGEDEYL